MRNLHFKHLRRSFKQALELEDQQMIEHFRDRIIEVYGEGIFLVLERQVMQELENEKGEDDSLC